MHHSRRSHQGSALLSALFIMTLVAIAATAMVLRLQQDIYRTRLIINNDKLYFASQAVIFWTMDELKQDKYQWNKADKKGRIVLFPKKLRHIYDNLVITGSLVDLQAKFNINNLTSKSDTAIFNQLLKLLEVKTSKRRALIQAIQHWIRPYQPGKNRYQLTQQYIKQKPAYYPPHKPMASISELRLIHRVDQKLYNKLLPYVTALPEKTQININTAPKMLLMSLGNGLSKKEAEDIMAKRKQLKATRLAEYNELLKKYSLPQKQLTTTSIYFLSVGKATSNDLQLVNYSVLKRLKNKKKKIMLKLISERLNSL